MSFAHGHTTFLLVYVDDILITGSDPTIVQSCISYLQTRFAIKTLGRLHYFLVIEVTSTDVGLRLAQLKYIHSLLSRTNMLQCKPCNTPMIIGTPLFTTDGSPFEDPHLYHSIVGALQYATITRPDIAFAVSRVSQFMHNPTIPHWVAVKRIMRYLQGTLSWLDHSSLQVLDSQCIL